MNHLQEIPVRLPKSTGKSGLGWVAKFSGNSLFPSLIISALNGRVFAKVGTHFYSIKN
jgi:hypothetical protein